MNFRSALILSLILSGSIIIWALVNPLLPADSSWGVMLLIALIGMDFAAVFYFFKGKVSMVGRYGPLIEVICYGVLILFCLVRVVV
jgi:hypothetical protein